MLATKLLVVPVLLDLLLNVWLLVSGFGSFLPLAVVFHVLVWLLVFVVVYWRVGQLRTKFTYNKKLARFWMYCILYTFGSGSIVAGMLLQNISLLMSEPISFVICAVMFLGFLIGITLHFPIVLYIRAREYLEDMRIYGEWPKFWTE